MKKVFLIMMAALITATSLFAQNNDRREDGYRSQVPERVYINPNYGYGVYDGYDYWGVPHFDSSVGLALYGSRYRRAASAKGWGVTLCALVAPTVGLTTIALSGDASTGVIIAGAAATVASLWGGIHLWRKGQREIDWMMDDYVRRYAPRPYSSSLSVGPTSSGVGLALNF